MDVILQFCNFPICFRISIILLNIETNPFNTIKQLTNSNDSRLLKKIGLMVYF